MLKVAFPNWYGASLNRSAPSELTCGSTANNLYAVCVSTAVCSLRRLQMRARGQEPRGGESIKLRDGSACEIM
jgi:hypothetical protein